jgi:hypothetical protein
MALTGDIKTIRFGSPGNSTQPMNFGVTASATVYRGSIATTRSGYLVASSSPQSTDVCWGMIDKAGAGTADTGPGVVGGTTNGSVTAEIATGSFFVQNGTGSDAFAATDVGSTAYVIDEQTMGKTSNSSTRPVGGTFLGLATTLAANRPDLKGMIAVKVGPTAGTTGGPS